MTRKPFGCGSLAMTLPESDSSRVVQASVPRNASTGFFACILLGAVSASGLLAFGIWIGKGLSGPSSFPPELLKATSTHGSSTMAVCTAPIDEETDGFFALDYQTGNLQGWVFNSRNGQFGGLFLTNISQALGPPGKNAEYLLVSGRVSSAAGGSGTRPADMVLYVVDVRGGNFAAFSVPWNRSMRNAGATQTSPFIAVGGDVIRPPMGPGGAGPRKPPAGNANQNPNANDPNANDPKPPANNANPAKNNPPKNNPPKNNPNNKNDKNNN
jgi:hypothetical protein